MYKPANIREFVTTAIYKVPTTQVINGRTAKAYVKADKPILKGKFKLKGTSELNANGLVVVNDKTSFITWWRDDFSASAILEINGVDYKILGTPENVENRGRYAVLNLERLDGGA